MICAACGHYVPDDLITCPVCAEERSRVALQQYQHHPLRMVAEGRGVLTTRAIDHVRHVQMFGCQKTFCGATVEAYHRRNSVLYQALRDPASLICETCIARIEALHAEALCSA